MKTNYFEVEIRCYTTKTLKQTPYHSLQLIQWWTVNTTSELMLRELKKTALEQKHSTMDVNLCSLRMHSSYLPSIPMGILDCSILMYIGNFQFFFGSVLFLHLIFTFAFILLGDIDDFYKKDRCLKFLCKEHFI